MRWWTCPTCNKPFHAPEGTQCPKCHPKPWAEMTPEQKAGGLVVLFVIFLMMFLTMVYYGNLFGVI